MNGWRERFRQRLESFMSGRNGTDALGRDIYIVSLILLIAEMFFRTGILYLVALAGFVYSLFRSFSRKLLSRRMENQKYLAFRGRITGRFHLLVRKWKERKTHKYYRCPSCRQTIRVPKGKGKIEISCPKCGGTFVKKT